jgi:hypothetical protein
MTPEQERAAFEAWANGRCELHLVNPAGRYSSATTKFAWEAYQAGRAALSAAQEDALDAARYRWLRSCNLAKHPAVRDRFELGDAHLDATIDAAMKGE